MHRAIVLLALILLAMGSTAMAQTRLALVPLDEASAGMADVALAELSGEEGIVFLERAALAELVRELKIAALGDFVPDPNLMENTQLFILLKEGRLVAFDSATGVRLKDGPAESQAALAEAVRDAVAKQRTFQAEGLRKLSAMPLVPVNLTEAQETLARRAEALLLQELCNRPDITLLERRHLLLLLNEPNAQENDLTARLFTGAVVMRLAAVSDGKDGIVVKLAFCSPDGQSSLGEDSLAIDADADLEKLCAGHVAQLALPEADKEDKAGEARNFIYEAWFAVSHGFSDAAVASAASAAALDRDYAMELSCIAFRAANQLFHAANQGGRQASSDLLLSTAIANLRLGATLTERCGGFGLHSRHVAALALQSPSAHTVAAMAPSQREELLEVIGQVIAIRKAQLDRELLPLAAAEGPRWPEGVFRLETRCQYVHELDRFCNLPCDFRWWVRLVQPELERLVAEARELRPELERIRAMDFKELYPVVSNPAVKRLRAPAHRQKGYLDPLVELQFFGFDPRQADEDSRLQHRRAFELMLSSNLLPLSLQGLEGLMGLRTDGNWLSRPDTVPETEYAFYYDQLLRLFREGVVAPARNLRARGGDAFLARRWEIEELAVTRFNCYRVFEGALLDGCEKWNRRTAEDAYRRLAAWEAASAARFGAGREDGKRQMRNYFRGHRRTLEARFGFRPEEEPLLAASPFAAVHSPLPRQRNVHAVGYEAGVFYAVSVDMERRRMTLHRIDEGTMAAAPVSILDRPINNSWQHGALLQEWCALLDVTTLCLFPRDGGEAEAVELAAFFKGIRTSMAGGGDRLFIAGGGLNGEAGTILEYNVHTREAKVIASTLDRTVKWPLQGTERPYGFGPLLCDAENRRLVLLLNESAPPESRAIYNVRLWAYYWESGEWAPLSNYLPCHSPSHHRIFLQDGVFWLAIDDGFGKINAAGDFQPLFLLDFGGGLRDRPVPYGDESYKKVVVDMGNAIPPEPCYVGLQWRDLYCRAFGGPYYFGQTAMVLLPQRRILRLAAEDFMPTNCYGGKWCVGVGKQGEWQIRRLKTPAETLQGASSQ